MATVQEGTSEAAAPFWWTHRTVADEADPLDATADDAAAACLSAITVQTAQHVAAHREVVASAAATGSSGAAALYAALQWDAVLLPHLTQLRKCMARAHEERVAEQAESAAAAAAGESAHASGNTGAAAAAAVAASLAATAAGPVDVAQARRVRSVQQQIYVAFFKAVLRGFADGAEGISKPMAEAKAASTDTEAAALQTSRVLEALLDGLLAQVLRCACGDGAAAAAAAALARSEDEERAKQPRRGQHRHAASSAWAGGWMTGMLPLYLRASRQQQEQQQAERLSEDEKEQACAAAAQGPPLPTSARCLLSYVGAFVRGAGLQLLPSEQAAALPDFTRVVHGVFEAQLRLAMCDAVAHATQGAATPLTPSEAAAHMRHAADVVGAVLDAQLYAESTTVIADADDADCTVAYAPLGAVRGERGVAEFSVAPLLVFSSHAVCGAWLAELGRWWAACKQLKERAAAPAAAPLDAESTTMLEQAWAGLQKQALAVVQLLCTYPDTTLHMAPYAAMLTELFYSAEAAAPSATSLERTKACLRDLRAALIPGGASTPSTAAAGRRQLRSHFRNARDGMTLAAVVAAQAPNWLSNALAIPLSAEDEDEKRKTDLDRDAAALALALLHNPLTVLTDWVLSRLTRTSAIADYVRVDAAVRNREVVEDRGAQQTAVSSPSATSVTRAKAIMDTPLTGPELVELCFPCHHRVFSLVDRAMQRALQGAQALRDADSCSSSSATDERHAEGVGSSAVAWMHPAALPAALARYVGAALDEAMMPPLHTISHEVVASEVLMYVAAVFRTLPCTVLPQLRAALVCVVGEGGHGLMAYLCHGIVAQQRYGLAAFFAPPLRALALDYATVDEVEESLALAARHPIGCAMAYAWELPRLYFWRAADMPVTEPAWHAHTAAHAYLCELLAPASPSSAAFIAVVQEAAATVQQRVVKAPLKSPTPSVAAYGKLTWARSLAIDAMAALYYGMCRWCAVQLDAATSASSEVALAAAARLTHALCAVRPEAAPAPHPFALSLRERLRAAASSLPPTESGEGEEERAPSRTPATATAAAGAPQPSPHHWLNSFWACTLDDVDASARVQAAAKRLLRDFSVQGGTHAPVKTLLGIRAMVEQRMRKEGEEEAAAVVAQQRAAMLADLEELLTQQQEPEMTAEETQAATDASTATPVRLVQPATQRAYLDQVHDALVKRARVSPVDGAVSAVVLGHLLRVLSDPQLPMRVTGQERQRLCQRFVFTLTSALPECTRLETVSCACSLRLVLQDIVLPFKQSFLPSSAATDLRACLSDTEADAFRMVHHTWGDAVAAVSKLATPATLLGEWKAAITLQQLGEPLSLVRSAATKIREGLRGAVHAGSRGAAAAALVHQLEFLEKSAARADRGGAVDVYHLFTLHPPPAPVAPAVVSSPIAAATSSSSPAQAETPTKRSSKRGGRHGGGAHHRKRSRERESGGGGGLKPRSSVKQRGGGRHRH